MSIQSTEEPSGIPVESRTLGSAASEAGIRQEPNVRVYATSDVFSTQGYKPRKQENETPDHPVPPPMERRNTAVILGQETAHP